MNVQAITTKVKQHIPPVLFALSIVSSTNLYAVEEKQFTLQKALSENISVRLEQKIQRLVDSANIAIGEKIHHLLIKKLDQLIAHK